jgi:hypothetical protein
VAQALGAASPHPTPPPAEVPPMVLPQGPAESLTLDAAMARHIEVALARTRGRIEGPDGAAALLAINPHTLRARMRKLGVEWRRFRPRPRDAARGASGQSAAPSGDHGPGRQ